MMRAWILALLIAACSPTPPTTTTPPPSVHPFPGSDLGGGGTEVGPGGDRLDASAGAAWFGDPKRTVKVCVNVHPEFGYAAEKIPALVEKTFDDWRGYLESRRLKVSIATRAKATLGCDGAEDLRLELGTETDEVARYRKYFTNPVGFPVRLGTGGDWRHGFVWIARGGSVLPHRAFPNWTEPKLAALLRHELGHVFGVGHVPGTIMSEEIARYLDLSDARLAGIDIFNQLYRCESCPATFTTSIGEVANAESDEERFTKLKVACAIFGRAPVGEVRVTLARLDGERAFQKVREIRVTDAAGEVKLREGPQPAAQTLFPLAWPLFKTAGHWVTSHELEYRKTFFRGDTSFEDEDKFQVSIRYRTHAFQPETQPAIDIYVDRQKDWLHRQLFEEVFVQWLFAEFYY